MFKVKFIDDQFVEPIDNQFLTHLQLFPALHPLRFALVRTDLRGVWPRSGNHER